MAVKTLSKPLFVILAAAAIGGGLGLYVWKEEHRPPLLEIYVFVLSSGRSMFIRTPEDHRVLVDGGANGDVIRDISAILPFYSRRIDAVVATDSEGRDTSGLIDAVSRYRVDKAYIPKLTVESLGLASSTDEIYRTFLNTLAERKIETLNVAAGDSVRFDDGTNLNFTFPAPASDFAYSKASAPELLFNLSYGSTRIDFIGGASLKVQKWLAAKEATSTNSATTLIVSGSALPGNIDSSLIAKIGPQYLVYSRSPNYKPPAEKAASSVKKKKPVIDPLAYINADDRHNLKEGGSVRIVSDGKNISVNLWGAR